MAHQKDIVFCCFCLELIVISGIKIVVPHYLCLYSLLFHRFLFIRYIMKLWRNCVAITESNMDAYGHLPISKKYNCVPIYKDDLCLRKWNDKLSLGHSMVCVCAFIHALVTYKIYDRSVYSGRASLYLIHLIQWLNQSSNILKVFDSKRVIKLFVFLLGYFS